MYEKNQTLVRWWGQKSWIIRGWHTANQPLKPRQILVRWLLIALAFLVVARVVVEIITPAGARVIPKTPLPSPVLSRAGRLTFMRPATWKLERLVGTYEYVSFEEKRWEPPGGQRIAERAWEEHLAEVTRFSDSGKTARFTEMLSSSPAVPFFLVRYPGDDNDQVKWDGLVAYDRGGVFLSTGGSLDQDSAARSALLTQGAHWKPLFDDVANPPGITHTSPAENSRRDATQDAPPGSFVTANGFFPSLSSTSETLYAKYVSDMEGFQLEVESQIVKAPSAKPFKDIATLKADLPFFLRFMSSIKKVREGDRTVAGLKGVEQVMVMKTPDEAMIGGHWWFAGEPNNPLRPRLDIIFEGPPSQEDELLKQWDTLLNSIKLP